MTVCSTQKLHLIVCLLSLLLFFACSEVSEPVPVPGWEFSLVAESTDPNVDKAQWPALFAATGEILRSRLPFVEVTHKVGDSIVVRCPQFLSYGANLPWFLGTGDVNLSFVSNKQRIRRVVRLLNSYSQNIEAVKPSAEAISNSFTTIVKETEPDSMPGIFLNVKEDDHQNFYFSASQLNSYSKIVNDPKFQDSLNILFDNDCRLGISLYADQEGDLSLLMLEGEPLDLSGSVKNDLNENNFGSEEHPGIELRPDVAADLADITRRHIGKGIAIMIDHYILLSAPIRMSIENGRLNFPMDGDSYPAYIVDQMLSGEKLPLKLKVIRRKSIMM